MKKKTSGIGKKGTTSVGGTVSFSIDTVVPEHSDSITGFRLDIAPQLSHFVSDNFAIGFTLGVGSRSGDLYEGLPTNVGFGVSFRRLFGSSGARLYIGIDLGPEFTIPETGDTVTFFVIGPRLGLLVPLNEHVAVDVGFRPSFAISTGDTGNLIRVPFGLGIEAFF